MSPAAKMNDVTDTPVAAARLEALFGAIHDRRMRGLPFVNEALRVEAVGFRRWEGRWLGVLITPWFMSLVLLPDESGRWDSVPVRETRRYAFPAGEFEFIGGFEPSFGEYQSCSLFSPVFEFLQHDVAQATAEAALAALLEPPRPSRPQG
jgi:[NiFe] hydrogenase assembly HybE family chaperone